jgi:Mn2+/Fe2+ NRAMP family transporter
VRGLVVPSIPDVDGDGLGWTVALMGGVGGTLTIICYAYWAREEGRTGASDLRTCRIDLAAGYAITALFGVAMVVIASGLELDAGKRGAGLLVELGGRCGESLGAWARWVFLIGAWCAIVSSMLGVWQAVPYVFADYVRIVGRRAGEVSVRSRAYRGYLLALGTLPMVALFTRFEQAQKVYAIVGAGFIPALAGALLFLCNRREMGGLRNGWLANGVLVVSIVLALVAGVFEVLKRLA